MIQVRDIMSVPVVSVEMDDMLYLVKDIFEQASFHHLPVVDNKVLKGIISDRDLLKALSPHLDTLSETQKDLGTLKIRVHQIMSRDPVSLYADDDISKAISAFNEHAFSCLPVVDQQGAPIGILTWRDILKLFQDSLPGEN